MKKPKVVKREKKQPLKLGPDVVWIKLVNGDEIIGQYVSETSGAVCIEEPCLMMYVGETFIFSEYGLFGRDRFTSFNVDNVITMIMVDDLMKEYYFKTLEASGIRSKEAFDKMVFNNIQAIKRIMKRRSDEEKRVPTDEELDEIENEENSEEKQGRMRIHEGDFESIPETKMELIDRVVKLAADKGLGKKKNENNT